MPSRISILLVPWLFALAAPFAAAQTEPDFTRDVRPIIARHCLKCHGPDDQARKGKLRLDVREMALAKVKSGDFAIVPGNTAKGTLLHRIFSADPDEVMPPPATKNPLSDDERRILKSWIAAGAKYKEHWALVAPVQASLPVVKQSDSPKNPIDRFILARLEAQGLQPSPQADRATLIRRVSLDLIGLPPTPAEVDAFISDTSPDAYEKVVDRLLANPHYGERWARRWLDLARYADTNGYEKDRVRSIWPYRDWVINALNADMPFDEFTIEQLAGDMLPNATPQQRIATGFHRNTMLNEEGGADPLEFRWKAIIDRTNVTATTWLGLTLGCAQCHTHKFDPITQREYYQMFAFFNNCDEPTMTVFTDASREHRREIEAKIAQLTADLPGKFPVPEIKVTVQAAQLKAEAAEWVQQPDGSILIGKQVENDGRMIKVPDSFSKRQDVTFQLSVEQGIAGSGVTAESSGPGSVDFRLRATGNAGPIADQTSFVNFTTAATLTPDARTIPEGLGNTSNLLCGVQTTHTGSFALATSPALSIGLGATQARNIADDDDSVGKLNAKFGLQSPVVDFRPLEQRRADALQRAFDDWLAKATPHAVQWTVLRPTDLKANAATLHLLDDNSVFASGDQTKRDVYDLKFTSDVRNITAVRLEAIPDGRLPNNGPGRIYYEGPAGSFFLSALTLLAGGQPVAMSRAVQTFAEGKNTAAGAIDNDPLSGWAIGGGQGKPQAAVFTLTNSLDSPGDLAMSMVFEKYYSAPLGHFRIAVTSDPRVMETPEFPADVEAILTISTADRSVDQRQRLLAYFLSIAPELKAQHAKIESLRQSIPTEPTTLVLAERPLDELRPTHLHHRGEYLQPTDLVQANTLSILPPLPPGVAHDRLALAKWLVDPRNPLVARVTVNRQWAAFFGTGIVSTLGDFGYQGETPSHPELLDWLAVELIKEGWSLKKIDRLIVTSATYQQSSRITPDLLERDPTNRLLARGPRVRLEAEQVRDYALSISGLLSEKIGGPSVFPPQPASVTTDGAYGALEWKVSAGEDRYRRGLYTFMKRTAPYAMFAAFDAPSGEACVARRDVSDSPLQSLTLLNDEVFTDAARALGKLTAAQPGDDQAKIAFLFRRCLARGPDEAERALVSGFHAAQEERFAAHELNAMDVAGDKNADAQNAAWIATARAILNLDEAITKN
jgi:mono/diheme cytochrome c family protein